MSKASAVLVQESTLIGCGQHDSQADQNSLKGQNIPSNDISQGSWSDTAAQSDAAAWQDMATAMLSLAELLNNVPSEERALLLAQSMSIEDPSGSAAPGYAAMRRFFLETSDLTASELTEQLAVDWTGAFRGVDRQRGPKPPYAGAWLAADGLGVQVMQEINQAYAEAGLGSTGEGLNRLDYLGVELEFIGHLAQRIASTTCAADTSATSTTCAAATCATAACASTAAANAAARQALAGFLDKYVLSWVGDYVAAARGCARTDFLRGFLDLLEALLREMREAL
ncbi:MAG: molecular chaperone TorD family protein [Coriobacteriales bacterium]|jgi:TorA maturation chaperone TorD|nr:molecular chaperone TorD family protein [Coriobacteriales bacterium]